jgi:hypothetical protein
MVKGVLKRVAIPLSIIAVLMAIVPSTIGLASYQAVHHTFGAVSGGGHDLFNWTGIALQSPDSSSSVPDATTNYNCDPSTGEASCEDVKLTVPRGVSPSTLYVKIAWTHPVWKAYLYVTSPDKSKTYGGPLGCDTDVFNKGCGNETALPVDEVTIPSPAPGDWTVRVAAVNIHDETYQGMASLVNADPFQYSKETLKALTKDLTKQQRVNIAFVGWKPDAQVLSDIRAALPDEYIPSSASKQSADANDTRDLPGSGLIQHEVNHYTGTDPTNSNCCTPPFTGRFVPYFQPIKFVPRYHFLAADDTYTKDLFGAMKAATSPNQDFGSDAVYATNVQNVPSHERAYLENYNAHYGGQFRGAHPAQCDPSDCKVDMIDEFKVEDWIHNTRLDPKYCNSFTDLQSGAKSGAQFINPDPNAVRDPYWDGNGTHAVNVDSQPQGTSQDITFFFIDTFFPTYADQYFNLGRYHTLASFDHIKDPDTGAAQQIDNARGWGGRFRFYFQDLGAAPSFYERENWLREEASVADGSAGFDPPIWQYRNDPSWNGTAAPSDPATMQVRAAGSVFGGVLGWDVNQGFAFKYIGSYLYRPIPSDAYVLATNNWIDFYSQPAQQGFYDINFSKVYNPALGIKALNSASPYATFTDSLPELPNLSTPNKLGCANNHHTLNVVPVQPVRDALTIQGCAQGVAENPIQHAIEDGKNHGALGTTVNTPSGPISIPDAGVNAGDLRNFVDHNRATYAPLKAGVFTVPVLNIYFEKLYNVAIPLIVGGLAEGTNDGEGWGQIDNLNERSVTKAAINCAASSPAAPACLPGGGPFSNARAMTYIVQHEAAHFQGLHHPHDGTASVEKAQGPEIPASPFTGQWHYYYSMNKWQYDMTASPTTYGHTYGIYEVVDQDRLMYGHVSEYAKQAQDWIADGYFNEAALGATSPSASLQQRETAMKSEKSTAATLFQNGDYLHAQYEMRNAMLHAKGFFFPAVAPHRMSLAEAADAAAFPACPAGASAAAFAGCSNAQDIVNGHEIFNINPQPVYSSDVCGAGIAVPTPITPVTGSTANLPNTGTALPVAALLLATSGLWSMLAGALAVVAVGGLVWRFRSRA